MNSEKQPSDQPPEENGRRIRVRYVELNGVKYRSRESNRVDAGGNLMERVNELYMADGSNKVFLQREVFDPALGLLTEVTRVDYTDGKTAEDKEEYEYRQQSAGLAFFRYVRRLAGAKTVEQTEKYDSAGRRPKELERVEYDQAGQPALRRLEEFDPDDGRLLQATTEFYENGLKVLEVVEIFSSADGRLIKRLSTSYEAGSEVSQTVEDLTTQEESNPADGAGPAEPILTQFTAMSVSKAEAAEAPAPQEPPASPAALLAGFIYAKSIEDNRQPSTPPPHLREIRRGEPTRAEAGDGPVPAAAETTAGSKEETSETAPAVQREAVERKQARGPETDAVDSEPEKTDFDSKGLQAVQEPPESRPVEEDSSQDTSPDSARPAERLVVSQTQLRTVPEPPPDEPPPNRQRSVKIVLVVAATALILAAVYYVFGAI